MSAVAVASWFSSDDSAILLVLWMTSCFHIIEHVMYGEAYSGGMSFSGRQHRLVEV